MSPFRLAFRVSLARFALAVLALGLTPVHAATFTVGTTGGCSHADLQTAVNTAHANPGPDTIRVNSETFTAQEVSINTGQELNIIGGHADCSAGQPTPNSRSTLDGTGGNPRSVMRIVVPTGGLVRLLNLNIRRGDLTASGTEGGGIYFEGNGGLGITETTIATNTAGFGAGLYLRGTGNEATVEFGTKVTVSGNTAWRSGGGVYVDQVKFSMLSPNSGIFLNEAQGTGDGGFGGGMVILAKSRDATAFIGPGMGSLGVIFNNKAKYGGGVAIESNGPDGNSTNAQLQVHSAVAGQPASIRDNVASELGGGIHMNGYAGTVTIDRVDVYALFWNAELRGNSAPEGAAIYSNPDNGGSFVWFNSDLRHFLPAPSDFICPAGEFCGGLYDNVARTPDGTPTEGAVVRMRQGIGNFRTNETTGASGNPAPPVRGGISVEGNRGGRLFYFDDDVDIELRDVLISDNQSSNALIQLGDGGYRAHFIDSTIAGNVVGSGHPIFRMGDADLEMRRSILWQPGVMLLQCSGCDKSFERVIASERASLDGGSGTQVVVAEPRFADPANGDYRLRAASPAVDYVPAISGDDRDVLGLARDVKLPIKVGAPGGMRDIGAFERQTLQPLVLNSDVDIDTRLWTELIAGTLSRDSQNASGGTSSGSLRVFRSSAATGQVSVAARQCIHLPGPGRYSLNGFGRAGATGGFPPPVLDTTQLRWELRHNGGEGCTGGTVAASGIKTLSTGGWNRPVDPAVIEVFPAQWTVQSSLVVNLAVVETNTERDNSIGWFDGITLEVASLVDVIFADGFD